MYESYQNLLVKSLSNHVCSNEHRLMFLSEPGPMPSPHHVSHVSKILAQIKISKKTLHKFQIRLCVFPTFYEESSFWITAKV